MDKESDVMVINVSPHHSHIESTTIYDMKSVSLNFHSWLCSNVSLFRLLESVQDLNYRFLSKLKYIQLYPLFKSLIWYLSVLTIIIFICIIDVDDAGFAKTQRMSLHEEAIIIKRCQIRWCSKYWGNLFNSL